jgi:hypothetical protein
MSLSVVAGGTLETARGRDESQSARGREKEVSVMAHS